jgi:hypothetical protein
MFRSMRRLVGVSLALLVAAHAHADPAAPQIGTLHRQREDAERLRQLQGGLEQPRPEPIGAARAPANATNPVDQRGGVMIGVTLLGVAGVSGLVTLTLLAGRSSAAPDGDTSSLDTAIVLTGTVTAVSGVIGLVLVVSNRSVRVGPTVSPKSVGLAISGTL